MTILTLAQINPTVSEIENNLTKINKIIDEAPENSIVMFPEMSLTGYPLEDLVFSSELQFKAEEAVRKLRENSLKHNKSVIVGSLGMPWKEGDLPSNTARLIQHGSETVSTKTALPTYGVFDERRLFKKGDKVLRFEKDGKNFLVLICEDVWEVDSPAMLEASQGADVVLVLNGSPYEQEKLKQRVKVMERVHARAGAQVSVYLNLVGGQDDIIFDGRSFVLTDKGIVKFLKGFDEDVVNIDLDEILQVQEVNLLEFFIPRIESMYRAVVLGIRDYVRKNGMTKVTLGASGGIDSALVLTMAADALGGENVLGVSMPSDYSSNHSIDDAEQLMKNLGGSYRKIPISTMFDSFMDKLNLTGIAEENIQARIRGVIVMGISNQEGYLVLAPGNKSELAVGYSTIYGDAVGGYAPIKDAYKTDVYEMARWRNSLPDAPIPVSSIEKAPSAELRPGQVDQESLPPYETLDAFLYNYIENRRDRGDLLKEYGEMTDEIIAKINRAEWKRRQYPIGAKLSTLSFGREREVPITR